MPTPPTTTTDERRAGPMVIALSLGVFMSSLDLFIVNLAFPSITRDFHGTPLGTLSWVLNAYTIVFAAVLVPAGRWADRVGRLRAYIAGLAVFTLGSLGCGLAPGVGVLVGARVLQAVGAGAMVSASLSLLLAVVPPARRAAAIGTWSALGALGAALGPVCGGVLVEAGWRWVFWVNLPVGVVSVVLARRLLPESRDETATTRPDLPGAVTLAGGVALLAWALVEAPTWGWGSAHFLAALAAAAVALAGVVARSARHHTPVLDLSLLRSRSFSGALAASVLYYAGFAAFVLNSVEFLTGVWHYSAVRAGLAVAPGPLMVLPVARLLSPRLAARWGGPGRVAAVGATVNAASQGLWLVLMQAHPAYATHLLPAQLIGGVGVGLSIPSLVAAGSASVPPARFGTGSGVLNMGRQVGSVLGVAGLVAILDHLRRSDPLATFHSGVGLVLAFFAASGVVSAVVLARRSAPAGATAAATATAAAVAAPVAPAAVVPAVRP